MTLTIELPLPPHACSGNSRGHWAKNSGAKKQYKIEAMLCARHSYEGSVFNPGWRWDPTKQTTVKATYFAHRGMPHVDGYRPTDDDNAIRALKDALDGFKDAGIFRDDSAKYVKWCGVTIHRNKKDVEKAGGGKPRVVIVLEQDGEAA